MLTLTEITRQESMMYSIIGNLLAGATTDQFTHLTAYIDSRMDSIKNCVIECNDVELSNYRNEYKFYEQFKAKYL